MRADFPLKDKYGFDDLVKVMRVLRGPGGCPWDAQQTHESIRKNFIEETYEAIEAIDAADPVLLQEELGDVLFSAENVSRFLDCDAEEALDAATVKFVRRFREMERLAAQQGCAVDDLSAAELDKLWKRAKEVFTKR